MPLSFLGLLKWFIAVVSVLLLSGLARSTAQGQTLLTGGGATFQHPIYARWIAEFQKLHPDIEIEYNAIGSGAGIREITAGVYDFGASDGPMDDAQLKEYRAKRGMAILHFPTLLGADVPTYNPAPVQELPRFNRNVPCRSATVRPRSILVWMDQN